MAGPEPANNAALSGAFIPLFSLGIPPNVIIALLLGALMLHGIQPGPLLLTEHPEIFSGTVASMYIGDVMLLALNLPLIGMWVKILKIPHKTLFPLVLLFCLIGVYCAGSNVLDIYVMVIFGVLGYVVQKLGYEPAPLVMAFVLGPLLEKNLHRALIMSGGSMKVVVSRPISAAALLVALFMVVSAGIPALQKRRKKVITEE